MREFCPRTCPFFVCFMQIHPSKSKADLQRSLYLSKYVSPFLCLLLHIAPLALLFFSYSFLFLLTLSLSLYIVVAAPVGNQVKLHDGVYLWCFLMLYSDFFLFFFNSVGVCETELYNCIRVRIKRVWCAIRLQIFFFVLFLLWLLRVDFTCAFHQKWPPKLPQHGKPPRVLPLKE